MFEWMNNKSHNNEYPLHSIPTVYGDFGLILSYCRVDGRAWS